MPSETGSFMCTEMTESKLNMKKKINQNQTTHEKSYNGTIWYLRDDFIFAVSVPTDLKILVWEKTGTRKRKVPILSQVYWKMMVLLLNSNSVMGVLCQPLPCLFCAHRVRSLSLLSSLCSTFPPYAENPTRILRRLPNIKSLMITIDAIGSNIKTKFLQSPSFLWFIFATFWAHTH